MPLGNYLRSLFIGEAIYVDDMPKFENELYLALVFSSRAHAKLISVDATEALQQEGVVDFISAKVRMMSCSQLTQMYMNIVQLNFAR